MKMYESRGIPILRFTNMISLVFVIFSMLVSSERSLIPKIVEDVYEGSYVLEKMSNFMWQIDGRGYDHVWPVMKLGWQIIAGSIIGFFGAAFGSVGGVGGGGIFVPMLTLIIGFDQKSSTAISKLRMFRGGEKHGKRSKIRKPGRSSFYFSVVDSSFNFFYCMVMGASISAVYYNLKLRHPTLDMPVIDYDLALLIQPMLMMGISIGVVFNVIFPDWLVTVLLIILFLGTSVKSFFRGIDTWKKETILIKEAAKISDTSETEQAEYIPLPGGPDRDSQKSKRKSEVSVIDNVSWKEFGLLVFVWVAYLAIQIVKNNTATCSTMYWVLNLMQIPVSLGVSLYEAVGLYNGNRVIASKGDAETRLKIHQLIIYCSFGIIAGIVGGLLGLGGGFIMGPLFLELGVPPQVSSATATFAMTFSSSMSVVEYYLLKRFPVPYAAYFTLVAMVAAFAGQHILRKLITFMGRASLIIFILASIIFISAISLGGFGISNMVKKIVSHEYMGFVNLCMYDSG